MKILLIRDGRIGDMLLITPVLAAIKKAHPDSRLAVLTNPYGRQAIENNPRVDRVIELPERPFNLSFYFRLRAEKFTHVLVIEKSSRYAHLAWISGAKIRAGFRNKQKFFLNRLADWSDGIHEAENAIRILESIGITEISRKLEVFPGPEDEKYVEQKLEEQRLNGKLLAGMDVNTGGDTKDLRLWPVEYFASLADRLTKMGFTVVFVCPDSGGQRIAKIRKKMENSSVEFPTQKITQLAALMKKMKIFIAQDTGPMHLAVAVRTPLAALFGMTDQGRTGPYGDTRFFRVVQYGMQCSPCKYLRHSPARNRCIDIERAVCMERLKPEKVFAEIQELLTV